MNSWLHVERKEEHYAILRDDDVITHLLVYSGFGMENQMFGLDFSWSMPHLKGHSFPILHLYNMRQT